MWMGTSLSPLALAGIFLGVWWVSTGGEAPVTSQLVNLAENKDCANPGEGF